MKVSIVIPAYNEEKYIKKTLRSVTDQVVEADEIIVINNNSTDKTEEIAKGFGVRVVREQVQGMIPARNRGFNEARHEIIARCDADVIVPRDWVKKIRDNFERRQIDALSGPIYFHDSKFLKSTKTVPSVVALESLKLISKGKRHLIGPNMSLTKEIWEKVRPIVTLDDKKVHEDMDLSLKIAQVKGRVGYDKTLIVGISARRLKKHPESFFLEYPVRVVKTFIENKDALKSIPRKSPRKQAKILISKLQFRARSFWKDIQA